MSLILADDHAYHCTYTTSIFGMSNAATFRAACRRHVAKLTMLASNKTLHDSTSQQENSYQNRRHFRTRVKGEVYPEMKLCELLVLVHCIYLPLILFACAASGQSYNIDSPVVPNCCDVIETAMAGDPIAF